MEKDLIKLQYENEYMKNRIEDLEEQKFGIDALMSSLHTMGCQKSKSEGKNDMSLFVGNAKEKVFINNEKKDEEKGEEKNWEAWDDNKIDGNGKNAFNYYLEVCVKKRVIKDLEARIAKMSQSFLEIENIVKMNDCPEPIPLSSYSYVKSMNKESVDKGCDGNDDDKDNDNKGCDGEGCCECEFDDDEYSDMPGLVPIVASGGVASDDIV